jgi:lipoprotein-anchoring transpeptidase ErfK/SrfK
MKDLTVTAEPRASIRSWVDASDPRRTWVQLGDDNGAGVGDGNSYQVTIAQAHDTDGLSLSHPVSFNVAVPARPTFVNLPNGTVTLKYGDTFTLQSSTDLANADVSTTSNIPTHVSVTASQIQVSLPQYQQGSEFDLTVASALSSEGAPLANPVRVHFVTPPAFDVPTLDPADGEVGIRPSAHPSVTFAEPVADQEAATQALQIDPPVAGQWKWPSSDTAVFVPDNGLPILSDLTITVHGGPNGPRNAAGGYLEGDQSATFRTTDYKKIDVSLSRQVMTLYENGAAVRTIYVATGVAAAPTPTGTFYVQMKAPQMRFQGVNPDGSHYDIPDVHWVMPFWGDYTIHGAYWRPRFGVPGSDGCVSMTDADAKIVYDWADVGTPVIIHS